MDKYYVSSSVIDRNIFKGVQMVRKSGLDCKVGHSEKPKVCYSVDLDVDWEGGCGEAGFNDFVKFLRQIVIA